MLTPELICTHLQARTRHSVLREMVKMAQAAGRVLDTDAFLTALEQREDLCSTAIEQGIAIPHPRHPQPYVISEPLIVIAHTQSGIGCGAPDGKLTDLFFMTASLDDRHHLHVLARLCRMLNDITFLNELRHTETSDQAYDLICTQEKNVID